MTETIQEKLRREAAFQDRYGDSLAGRIMRAAADAIDARDAEVEQQRKANAELISMANRARIGQLEAEGLADCPLHGDFGNRCRACLVKCETVYCASCAEIVARCAHGNPAGDCSACDVDGDLAFDAQRGDALGGRR